MSLGFQPARQRPFTSARGRASVLLLALVGLAGAVAGPPAPAASDVGPGTRPAAKRIWLARDELRRLPISGEAWRRVKAVADGELGEPNVGSQNSVHDTKTVAVALVYVRTGKVVYRRKAAAAIVAAVDASSRQAPLALARNVVSYVIAADLVDLRDYDWIKEARFRRWLIGVRGTLIKLHEKRPNNFGTMAGASRAAIAVYLGDRLELARTAEVFRGWLGDRDAYAGFKYGDLSWQADPRLPVGVNPLGATRDGRAIDGALPEELRRGCSFRLPPCPTGYVWEGLQGALVQAQILARQGYDTWNWEDQALRRAMQFLADLSTQYPDDGWWATGDDTWQPWLVNSVYRTSFPTRPVAQPGKNMGWTDWTHLRPVCGLLPPGLGRGDPTRCGEP